MIKEDGFDPLLDIGPLECKPGKPFARADIHEATEMVGKVEWFVDGRRVAVEETYECQTCLEEWTV